MTRLSVTQLCTLHFVDSGRKTRDRRSSWRFHTSLKVCGCGREGVLVMRMKYPCLYADADGESHFKDVEIEFQETDFAPPAPPVSVSSFRRATQCGFLSDPAGWYGDSHPTPQRQFFFYLEGPSRSQSQRWRGPSLWTGGHTPLGGHNRQGPCHPVCRFDRFPECSGTIARLSIGGEHRWCGPIGLEG